LAAISERGFAEVEMREWSVDIEAETYPDHDEVSADEILERLARYAPALSLGPAGLDVRVNVKATDIYKAFERAWEAVHKAIPGVKPVRVDVEAVEDLGRRLNESNKPDVVGVAELAEMLGVTKQRASALAQENSGFPPPITFLKSGPIWKRSHVARFAGKWIRKPGRRPSNAATDDNNSVRAKATAARPPAIVSGRGK
jgi:hypothetical protein